MTRPAVTVIIPTRNRLHQTVAAVDSALRQMVGVQVIVVDDASDDGTVERLRARFGTRVEVVRLPHRSGANVARNAGVALAQANHVAFLDSDDRYLPGKLAAQLAAIGTAGFSVTGHRTSCGATYRPPATAAYDLARRNGLGGTSMLMVRRDLIRAEPFDPDLPAAQDWELYLRLSNHGPPVILPQAYVYCDTRGADRMTRHARRRALGHRRMQLRHFPPTAPLPRVARQVQALNRVLLADAVRRRVSRARRAVLWLCRAVLVRLPARLVMGPNRP